MDTPNTDNLKLSDAISKKYKLKDGARNKFFQGKHGVVDLSTISLKAADALVAAGCTQIELITPATAAPPATAAKTT